ncbi:MAG TPA: Cys-tRNA(Pro) deacylase [Rectinemataceae bacterium]|nr:Cys-tRNA(Pro) deacylase [Rectinemataceae bacterium]
MSAAGKTNVQRILEAAVIAHRVVAYEVDESDLSAESAAAKLGLPAERVWKTLAVRGESGGLALCVIPGDAELDFKKVAKALGEHRVALLPLRELEEETGYVRGGCSPIGTKRRLPTLIDETVALFDEISVSAGKRGLQIVIAPTDLARLVSAQYADIT